MTREDFRTKVADVLEVPSVDDATRFRDLPGWCSLQAFGLLVMLENDCGVRLDAVVSRELLQTVFTPPLPLHDGGVIVRDGRVIAGGRTGLTAVSSAALFALALVFAPIFLAIPAFATAPALIIVGYMMLSSAVEIDFTDPSEAVPAFLAIVGMPFAYSISEGIMWGVISYTLVNLIAGKARKIHWIMYILTALFIAKYALM